MRRSISDHMYRMAVLAMCVSDQTLDISRYCARFNAVNVPVDVELRCVMMAVVHDLAEAQGAVVTACRNSPLTPSSRLQSATLHPKRAFRRQKSRGANPCVSSARSPPPLALDDDVAAGCRRPCKTSCTRCYTIVPPRTAVCISLVTPSI
jgi:hypothetical protein